MQIYNKVLFSTTILIFFVINGHLAVFFLDNHLSSPWLIYKQTCRWPKIRRKWAMLINSWYLMFYRLHALLFLGSSRWFQPKSLLFSANLHALTLQCHLFCGANWCLLQCNLIAFAGKTAFFNRIITCLLPVCLLIFSRLKLLKSHFWSIIWVK